jgi:molecular chaperone GrpE
MTDHNQDKNKNDVKPVEIEVEAQSEMDSTTQKVDESQEELSGQPAMVVEELRTEIEALQAELAESRTRADEYLDGWQRSRAEFANYKKRIERDQLAVSQNAAGRIIKRYLEILDDLERALKNRPQEGEGAAWANGIELIYRKFKSILESEGITPMEAEGQQFDPNLHEAITSEESDDHESGQIIEVLQQGYMLGDRVLRPAMVRVAR